MTDLLIEVSLTMHKKSELAILVASTFIYFSAGADVKTPKWFQSTDSSELNIMKFKSISDDKVVGETTIKSKEAIKTIIDRIQALPANGDMMIKWGPKAERTYLSFQSPGKDSQVIQLIGNRFKTPSTGFLSEKTPQEEALIRDIDALVAPGLNKRILRLKDHPVKFKDFVIKYVGTEHTPQDPNGPTIGPTNDTHFEVWENGSANKTTLSIFDGQLPPQPQEFVVGKKVYYLLTYQNLARESLAPNYFEVSDKLPKRR